MGACETRDKEERGEPLKRSQPSTCWARGAGRGQEELNGVAKTLTEDHTSEEISRLRSEMAALKRENRGLRERLASCLEQLEGPAQVTPGRKPKSKEVSFNGPSSGTPDGTPKRPKSKHVEFTDAAFFGAGMTEDPHLLNAIIKELWEFVSMWFENKMRQDVEPAIQNVMPAGLGFQFGDECNLGTTPISMHDAVTTTYQQPGSVEGEDIENVRIVGELQYHGDCVLEATVSAGKLMVTDLTMAGAIVIELIHMVPQPPFFSGVRLYFPNPPKIDLQVESEMLGLNISFAFIRGKIIQALSGVIANKVVLPNRVAFALNQELDPFPLRHPRPQGVLRVVVLEAKDLRDPGRMLSVDPYVTVSVGSTSWNTPPAKGTLSPTWDDAVNDFFVMDRLAQVLRIEVRDADNGYLGSQALKKTDLLGRVEATIADLVDAQDGATPCERWLRLAVDGAEFGEVRVQVQWRPLATVKNLSSALASNPEENCWALGKKNTAAWVLFVGVYSATMLPPAPDGTRHWVSISLTDADSEQQVAQVNSAIGCSKAPVQKDIDRLCRLGLSDESMADTLECDVSRVRRYLKRRSQSADPYTPPSDASCRSLVDVEWDAPTLLLLESVKSIKMTATVWREGVDGNFSLTRIFSASSSSKSKEGNHPLGSASYMLGDLLQCQRLFFIEEFPLEGSTDARSAAASLKLRLQIRPLLPPPAADSSSVLRRRRARTLTKGAFSSLPRPTVLGRAMTKEKSLCDFHTPDHSSDSESEASES